MPIILKSTSPNIVKHTISSIRLLFVLLLRYVCVSLCCEGFFWKLIWIGANSIFFVNTPLQKIRITYKHIAKLKSDSFSSLRCLGIIHYVCFVFETCALQQIIHNEAATTTKTNTNNLCNFPVFSPLFSPPPQLSRAVCICRLFHVISFR